MPVDLTIPFCVMLSITLVVLHIVFARDSRLLYAAGTILALPCMTYILPVGFFHVGALAGNTWAMQKLGSAYYLGTPRFESLGLFYYNESIRLGNYDAKLELAMILKGEARNENINRYHSKPHVSEDVERESLRQSEKWRRAKALLESAIGPGSNRAINELHEMELEEDPTALGRGIFLIRHARSETQKTYHSGSPAFFDHLKISQDWKEGMRLLKEIKHGENRWLSDLYLFELLEVCPEIAGSGAITISREIARCKTRPLIMTSDERRLMINAENWTNGVSLIKIEAESGNDSAKDLLERIDVFMEHR